MENKKYHIIPEEWIDKQLKYANGHEFVYNRIKEEFPSEEINKQEERFKMPTDKQLIDMAIVFNNGKLDREKLADMVGMCQLVLNRLSESGDFLTPSSFEKPKPI